MPNVPTKEVPRKHSSLPHRWPTSTLILTAAILIGGCSPPAGDPANLPGLTLYASFDRSPEADRADGPREPLARNGLEIIGKGKRAGCVRFPYNSALTYDAPGNLFAESGTVAFWWRPEEPMGRTSFPLIRISYAQRSTWSYVFAAVSWNGSGLSAQFIDRDMETHRAAASEEIVPAVGKWHHVTLTWSEADGFSLYLNGDRIAEEQGPMHLAANLDQLGIMTNAVTPHHTAGTERKASVDELMVFDRHLTQDQVERLAKGRGPGEAPESVASGTETARRLWVERHGWKDPGAVPEINSPTRFRLVKLPGATDLGKFWIKGSDGKRETTWPPLMNHGYHDEGKEIKFWCAAEPFNLLKVEGNLSGQIYRIRQGRRSLLLDRSDNSSETTYHRLPQAVRADSIVIEREGGILGDISLYMVDNRKPKWTDSKRYVAAFAEGPPGVVRAIAGRYPPGQRSLLSCLPAGDGTSSGTGADTVGTNLPIVHLALPASDEELALGAVTLRLDKPARNSSGTKPIRLNLSLKDPLYPVRDLIDVDVELTPGGDESPEITLDIRDLIVGSGTPLWMTVSSDDPGFGPEVLAGSEIILNLVRSATAQKEYIADRLVHLKTSFQMLSEARPWMRLGRGTSPDELRRRLKLIDELFLLLEELERVDPTNKIAAAYRGWIFRSNPPPQYTQPKLPSPEIPRWAFQQTVLIKKFRQVADWWISNRQLPTGEIGGGLGDDSDMIQNWPGLALLDGPAPAIGRSARLVMDACYLGGDVVDGMNQMRTDALHAYEEGMNALPLQVLLDYGNPVIVEECMATARHYDRLTGINEAGHRHFRSFTYSTDDLIEEGYHARQDRYSALLFHPGLYLAWYNGHQGTKKILTEYADALLDHWTDDEYPRLATGIMFPTDEEISHERPGGDVVHLLWGCYDLTGDKKYLTPFREALKAGDYNMIVSVNGRALEALGDAPDADSIIAYARRYDVWDHNLQTDERGCLARTLAWSATGDNLFLEDYQAALIRHMDQNMYIYTDAHQYTDRIWLLHRSTQRVRLGGIPHYRGAIYPGHAVSWENTGGQAAFLVRDSGPDRLRITAYNLSSGSRTVIMRPWQLANGTYRIRVGADIDEDGKLDRRVRGKTINIKRYEAIRIALPGKRNTIIELEQTKRGKELKQLPDLALAREEFRLDGENKALTFKVHNIGSVASGGFRLTAVDDRGRKLLDKKYDSIPAPLDLRPKTIDIEVTG
ncbi:LamG-like jellyroll fold domain-containing protein, partial [candidate division KSB1 bacterium]